MQINAEWHAGVNMFSAIFFLRILFRNYWSYIDQRVACDYYPLCVHTMPVNKRLLAIAAVIFLLASLFLILLPLSFSDVQIYEVKYEIKCPIRDCCFFLM